MLSKFTRTPLAVRDARNAMPELFRTSLKCHILCNFTMRHAHILDRYTHVHANDESLHTHAANLKVRYVHAASMHAAMLHDDDSRHASSSDHQASLFFFCSNAANAFFVCAPIQLSKASFVGHLVRRILK